MKKGIVFAFIAAVLVLALIGVVSAAPAVADTITTFIDDVINFLEPLLTRIVGDLGTSNTSDILLAKVILMVIVLAVVYVVLSQMPMFAGNSWVLWTISIGVSVLGIRFVGPDVVNTIILSHSAMAVAMTAIIPFAIYAVFVEWGLQAPTVPSIVRKVAWIFFASVFIGLWFVRSSELPNLAWIYPATAAGAVVMALIDGTIQGWFMRGRVSRISAAAKGESALAIKTRINQISALHQGNPAGYTGITPAGQGKPAGVDAYLADLKYYTDELARLGA